MAALAVGEPLVQLARLGIHHVRGQRAGVAAEKQVRERAVAPEEADEVQADERLDERVEERVLRGRADPAREHEPVRERELEVARDQDGLELLAGRRVTVGDDADRLDHRHLLVLELGQQPVLPPREPRRQLLQREERAADLDEANDVPMDPARDLDEPVRRPFLQRLLPRQLQQARVRGAGDEPEGRGLGGRHAS